MNTACFGDGFDLANGQGKGRWATSGTVRAFRKPDYSRIEHANQHPFYEFVASRLADALRINVPRVELSMHADGPVAYVYEISATLSYSHIKWHEPCQFLGPLVMPRLDQFAGIIVLDALVGAQDRPSNPGNHVYSLAAQTWWGVDFNESFQDDFDQPYEPEFVEAVRKSWARISANELAIAQNLDPKLFHEIAYARPAAYASIEERGRVADFLERRQKELGDVILAWLHRRS